MDNSQLPGMVKTGVGEETGDGAETGEGVEGVVPTLADPRQIKTRTDGA